MMNDPTNVLVPSDSVTITPARATANPDLPSVVTEAEAREAAAGLNLRYFNPQKAALMKRIGMFQAQTGVIHLGVGRLAVADEVLETLMETAVDIATDSSHKTEDRVAALMAGKNLVDSLQRSIAMVAEFHSDKLLGDGAQKKRVFSDQPIVPIQAQTVNVNVVDNSTSKQQS